MDPSHSTIPASDKYHSLQVGIERFLPIDRFASTKYTTSYFHSPAPSTSYRIPFESSLFDPEASSKSWAETYEPTQEHLDYIAGELYNFDQYYYDTSTGPAILLHRTAPTLKTAPTSSTVSPYIHFSQPTIMSLIRNKLGISLSEDRCALVFHLISTLRTRLARSLTILPSLSLCLSNALQFTACSRLATSERSSAEYTSTHQDAVSFTTDTLHNIHQNLNNTILQLVIELLYKTIRFTASSTAKLAYSYPFTLPTTPEQRKLVLNQISHSKMVFFNEIFQNMPKPAHPTIFPHLSLSFVIKNNNEWSNTNTIDLCEHETYLHTNHITIPINTLHQFGNNHSEIANHINYLITSHISNQISLFNQKHQNGTNFDLSHLTAHISADFTQYRVEHLRPYLNTSMIDSFSRALNPPSIDPASNLFSMGSSLVNLTTKTAPGLASHIKFTQYPRRTHYTQQIISYLLSLHSKLQKFLQLYTYGEDNMFLNMFSPCCKTNHSNSTFPTPKNALFSIQQHFLNLLTTFSPPTTTPELQKSTLTPGLERIRRDQYIESIFFHFFTIDTKCVQNGFTALTHLKFNGNLPHSTHSHTVYLQKLPYPSPQSKKSVFSSYRLKLVPIILSAQSRTAIPHELRPCLIKSSHSSIEPLQEQQSNISIELTEIRKIELSDLPNRVNITTSIPCIQNTSKKSENNSSLINFDVFTTNQFIAPCCTTYRALMAGQIATKVPYGSLLLQFYNFVMERIFYTTLTQHTYELNEKGSGWDSCQLSLHLHEHMSVDNLITSQTNTEQNARTNTLVFPPPQQNICISDLFTSLVVLSLPHIFDTVMETIFAQVLKPLKE